MSDLRLSAATKAMLAAAKRDGPGAAARAKMWAGVASTLGGAAAVGGAAAGGGGASGTAVAGTGAAKMLVVGALLGGALTVGLAATLLHVKAVPSDASPPPAHVVVVPGAGPEARGVTGVMPGVTPPQEGAPPSAVIAAGAGAAPYEPRVVPTTPVIVVAPVTVTPPASAIPVEPSCAPHCKARPVAAQGGSTADALAREASLVGEARKALGRGDPSAALRTIKAARALPSHQLMPEELAVESQALRALGRSTDANEVDGVLRSRYPDSALAR